MNKRNLADLLWNVADTLHGQFQPSLDGRITPPLLECATITW